MRHHDSHIPHGKATPGQVNRHARSNIRFGSRWHDLAWSTAQQSHAIEIAQSVRDAKHTGDVTE